MKIALFGLGRVGLPLALYIADKNHTVTGYDIDQTRIDAVKSLKFPFMEAGAQELLEKTLNRTFTIAGSPADAIKNADAIILTVGTPVNGYMNPSFSQIDQVFNSIAGHLQKDQLIILRSTLAPGTTERLKRFLETNTGFKVGEDLYLAYCPERTAEGKTIEEMPLIPQLIGSLDAKSARKASELFATLSPELIKSDARSVEIAKLICNMYRYINFALANELMMIADKHKRDIYEIVNLVNHNYVRGGVLTPGFSAGPCLFKDGFFLINDTPFTELISTSWSINERVPNYLVEKIENLTDIVGVKIAVLGLAFKKNSDDPRDSLAYKLVKILQNKGAKPAAHDPFIQTGKLESVLKDAQIIFISTNHDLYKETGLEKIIGMTGQPQVIVCDIWDIFKTGKIISKHNQS
jgi:UDP-N-acetyl-D-mannosaminuronic acid dehydrogenase